jgi:putative ABC transport system permease protein
VIAVLILVIAVINYINLATAKSAARAREVGIRKVSGSHKAGLILQFIGESVLTVAVASLLAVVIVLAFLPFFNQLTGKEITVNILPGFTIISAIVILILLVGTAAGAYPAFVLASFNPVSVLRGTMNPGSVSKTLRGILVVFQFAVSIIIIIGAFAVYRQLSFMTSSDMGFDKKNLLVVRRPDFLGNKIESLKEQLLMIPGVAGCANSAAIPGKIFSNNGFLLDNDPTKSTYLINETMVSHGFAEYMGIRLAEGRFISKEYNDTLSILINESAVKYLGLTDPVGKYLLQPAPGSRFDRLQIVGVMKDFNIESLHQRITPVGFRLMPGNYEGYLCIRLNGKDMNASIRSIEKLWKDFSGNKPFDYTFFDEDFNRVYEAEFKAGKLFIMFAVLAISIACLGLIGLITYMTTIRTKEIGIRKTYGSSGATIVSLFSKEVMGLIFISSLIAYPVAWFGIRIWLGTFAEKTTIGLLIYLIASLLGLMIGLLSILYHAVRAARLNPAESLRYK